MSRRPVIAGYLRTPFQPSRKGAFAGVRPDDLLAAVFRGLVDRAGIDPALVEDVLAGCSFPEGEQGFNLARSAWLLAGLPDSVPGVTVNRFCGSSMQAVHTAVGMIAAGAGEVFVCGGVESMSRVPPPGFNFLPNPRMREVCPQAYVAMGLTAETLADRFAIARAEQEAFTLRSHRLAGAALAAGGFADEILPVTLPDGSAVAADGILRPDTTAEALAALKPAFRQDGTVTAATSSPLTDGAAAVLVVSEGFAERHGLTPLAVVRALAVTGCPPEIMGIGPVAATGKALDRAGLTLPDIDVIELNEAFAAQALAVGRALDLDWERTNRHGGALALGHPPGASGARLIGKAASLLKSEGKRLALATMCVGGGQGIATILEAC